MSKICTKPGCGAERLIGTPCHDFDCPQRTVSANEFHLELTTLRASLATSEAELKVVRLRAKSAEGLVKMESERREQAEAFAEKYGSERNELAEKLKQSEARREEAEKRARVFEHAAEATLLVENQVRSQLEAYEKQCAQLREAGTKALKELEIFQEMFPGECLERKQAREALEAALSSTPSGEWVRKEEVEKLQKENCMANSSLKQAERTFVKFTSDLAARDAVIRQQNQALSKGPYEGQSGNLPLQISIWCDEYKNPAIAAAKPFLKEGEA